MNVKVKGIESRIDLLDTTVEEKNLKILSEILEAVPGALSYKERFGTDDNTLVQMCLISGGVSYIYPSLYTFFE